MVMKKNVLPGLTALLMSVAMILAGCSNPASPENPSPAGPTGPTGGDTTTTTNAPTAPDVTQKISKDQSDALRTALNATEKDKAENFEITEDVSNVISDVKIKGKVFFTTPATKVVAVKLQDVKLEGSGTIQVNRNIRLILSKSSQGSSSINNASINYDTEGATTTQDTCASFSKQIIINEGGILEAGKGVIFDTASGGLVIYKDGKLHDSALSSTDLTFSEVKDSEFISITNANYPTPFVKPTTAGKYKAYKVTKTVANGLALVKESTTELTRGSVAEDNSGSQYNPIITKLNNEGIAGWDPASSATFSSEKYIYFGSDYKDTLSNIASPYFTLITGNATITTGTTIANKEWWEDNATFVTLSGTVPASTNIDVKETKFPVMIPQSKLISTGGTSTITIMSNAYVDVASDPNVVTNNNTLTGYGAFKGGIFVKSGGAVRDSAWMGWPLGNGSTFNVEYGGKIAVGQGYRNGKTARATTSEGGGAQGDHVSYLFNGWFLGPDASTNEIPTKARWETNAKWGTTGSYVAITADNVILIGSIKVQENTGIIYNVNIGQDSVLTIAAGKTLDLNTGRGIYAAKVDGTKEGIVGDKAAKGTDPGKLVLASGTGKLTRDGNFGGDAPSLLSGGSNNTYTYNSGTPAANLATNSFTVDTNQSKFYTLEP